MRNASLFRHLQIAILTLGAATTASAAEVRGRLLLGPYQPPQEETARPSFHWELDNGFKETLRDHIPAQREIAVVLTGDAGGDTGEVLVTLSGGSLLPSTIVMGKGSTLAIENRDEVAHEVKAVGLDGFSGEAIAPGGKRAINLTSPGAWPLRDTLVPHARGHLHVRDDVVAVGKVEDNGAFTFEDVPEGQYTLRVFHGAREIASQAVEVGSKTTTLDPITPATENE